MYTTKQYYMYRFANDLMVNSNFEVLYINLEANEIWLEKYKNKTSNLIRLIHRDFDWKNHLKSDIASTFHRIKAMKKHLQGKNIEVYNIYFAAHEPVDDWSILKKPMQLNEKNPPKMNVYYFTDENLADENERLFQGTSLSLDNDYKLNEDIDKETAVEQYKTNITKKLYVKNKKKSEVFNFGKPIFTYILIAFNLFMFMMLELNGSSLDISNLIKSGAKYNPAIIDGEWWRIISSMFLHIGIFHLIMNMLALYYLGMIVEKIYGSFRFLIIYFLAGILGGLVSFALSINVSAGASGALFGLFGALLFFGLIYKQLFLQTMGKGILIVIGINIVFGFSVPQIDMGAHIGGLIGGFLAAAIVYLPTKTKWVNQLLAILCYLLLAGGVVFYGIQENLDNPQYQLMQAEERIRVKKYDQAMIHATQGLENPKEFEAELLFQRAYAQIELGQTRDAISDLEKSTEIKPDFPEAHFNLAILYYESGLFKKAKHAITDAKKSDFSNDDFDEVYEKIMKEIE